MCHKARKRVSSPARTLLVRHGSRQCCQKGTKTTPARHHGRLAVRRHSVHDRLLPVRVGGRCAQHTGSAESSEGLDRLLPARCRSVYTLCEPTGGGCVADPSKTPPRTWVVPSRPPSRSHNQMLMAIRIQNSLHLSQTLQSFDASAIMTVFRQVACGRTPPCVAPVGRSTRPTSAERAVLVQ